MKTRIPPVLITFALVCFAHLPKGQAVVPPPDGGYPGFTTAEGNQALQNLTTGLGNTAAGWHSLFANTTGNLNTAIGAGTLLLNTGDNNTATGALALLSNTTGSSNTAIGYEALVFNTTGVQNTASGYYSLHANTEGFGNTAFGDLALFSNTIGHNNIALGWGAGGDLTTGSGNICIGHRGLNAESSTIRIGTTDLQTSTYIAGIAGQTVGAGGSTCYVDNDGKLGVFLSARRFKTDIADMAVSVRRSWPCVPSLSITSPSWIRLASRSSALSPRRWRR
jgi:hypothetical protein